MSQNISYICKMKKEDIYYSIIFYIALAGISFLLAPILTYLFLIFGALIAGVGFILDVIFSILFWWAGFEGGIGTMIMDCVTVMSPTTAWLIFMGIVTIIFGKIWVDCLPEDDAKEKEKEKESNVYVIVRDIRRKAMTGAISTKEANNQITSAFQKWGRRLGLSQQIIQNCCKEYAIQEASYTSPATVNPPVEVYREQLPLGMLVQPFRDDYKNGKITMEEANDMIKTIVDNWVKNRNYIPEKADEMYEKFKVKPKKKK